MKDKITCPKCEGKKIIQVAETDLCKKPDCMPVRSNCPATPMDCHKGYMACDLCHGEGKVDPAELFEVECETCNGHGRLPVTPDGYLPHDHDRDCDICNGTGWRPMTAKELEECSVSTADVLRLTDSFTKSEITSSALFYANEGALTHNGKPVRLRSVREGE
jgi:DnaJ-class molecular chaperone